LVGSHLDTVKNGGKYDGACGVISALAAVKKLIKRGIKVKKSIEVVALVEEEGSRYEIGYVGSRAMIGALTQDDLKETDTDGISLSKAMENAGYDPRLIHEAARSDIAAYIELHIEQGPVLDLSNAKVGIVENITGLFSWMIEIKGTQNHAGTTPMAVRKDPVCVAAQFICDLTEQAKLISNTATVTVGKIQAFPGVSNVIADRVQLTVDIRDAYKEKLLEIDLYLTNALKAIETHGFTVCAKNMCREMPAKLDTDLTEMLADTSNKIGLEFIRMNSGAGHDAQLFAEKFPACMIFIPSRDGISHSPLEYTSVEALDDGLKLLEKVLLGLAVGWENVCKHQATDHCHNISPIT